MKTFIEWLRLREFEDTVVSTRSAQRFPGEADPRQFGFHVPSSKKKKTDKKTGKKADKKAEPNV